MTLLTSASHDHEQTSLSILHAAVRRHPCVRFATSLSPEDMVLTDMMARQGIPVETFTLDTGKLHAETLALIEVVQNRYAIEINRVYPHSEELEALEREQRFSAIYESLIARKSCCEVRKVRPLARALAGADAWITGQRRSQSTTRAQLPLTEHDPVHGIEKLNPLALWSAEQVADYLRRNYVPTNPLHSQGYRSIGCAPCTRAIGPHEHERAGRWWWEDPEHKECGLHNNHRYKLNSSTFKPKPQ